MDNYCKCGCGNIVTPDKRGRKRVFVRGHRRGKFCHFYGKSLNGPNNPAWKGGRVKHSNGYILIYSPNHPRSNNMGYVPEHVLVCERALGHYLPDKAIPHHVNGIKSDNLPSNLVLCQDASYHSLLHKRFTALMSCGCASWRKCWICQGYDKPENIYYGPNHRSGFHLKCNEDYIKNGCNIVKYRLLLLNRKKAEDIKNIKWDEDRKSE